MLTFYPEDINLQILSKVRHGGRYQKTCVCLWAVYLAEKSRRIQMKSLFLLQGSISPLLTDSHCHWGSRGWPAPWNLGQSGKVSGSWARLGGWAGFRPAQPNAKSCYNARNIVFCPLRSCSVWPALINSSPKQAVHLAVINWTINSLKHTWLIISSITLCFGHYPWISQGWA